MKVQAEVLWEYGGTWKMEDVDLGAPAPGKVLVRIAASGICHSDGHSVTGDVLTPLPMVGGHEGAGTVVAVGENVSRVAVGDQVIPPSRPAGSAVGAAPRANLCNQGAAAMTVETYDGTVRRHIGDTLISALCQLGTFSDHVVVSEMQTVTIDKDIPEHGHSWLRASAVISADSSAAFTTCRSGDGTGFRLREGHRFDVPSGARRRPDLLHRRWAGPAGPALARVVVRR
jgi:Zn-dependent alcohol dehydrogenase